MSSGTSHGRYNKPSICRSSIFQNGFSKSCSFVFCCLESKSENSGRQRQVVINCFWNMNILNVYMLLFQKKANSVGSRSSIIAANSNQEYNVFFLKKMVIKLFFSWF